MDVNLSAEAKAVGVPTTPTVERENKANVQIPPVQPGTESSKGALDEKSLQGDRQRRDGQLSREELAQRVEEIQKRFDAMGTKLGFSLSEKPEAVVVQVTNRKTGELVKQIPSEEVLALQAKLEDLVGLLFDEQV